MPVWVKAIIGLSVALVILAIAYQFSTGSGGSADFGLFHAKIPPNSPRQLSAKGKVHITLNKLIVYKDGDRLTDGKGDFIWKFSVNGKPLAEEKAEQNIGDGESVNIDTSINFAPPASNILTINGYVIEKDGLLSGSDDRIDFNEIISLNSLSKAPIHLRPNQGSDPDVEIILLVQKE